jgi:sulfonate transport system substrate-binding protein
MLHRWHDVCVQSVREALVIRKCEIERLSRPEEQIGGIMNIAKTAKQFALAGLIGILAGGWTLAHAQEPLKIRIGWAVAPAQLTPILFSQGGIAKHLGQSYTLEPIRFAGSSLTLQALSTGDLDIAPMTFNVLGPAILNAGMTDLRIIADEIRDGVEGYETNRYMVLKDGPIQNIEDLKGKVAAVNGIGGGQDIFMRVMLRRHGLETPRDYTVIEAQFPSMGSLMIEKKADLVVGVKPFILDPAFRAAGRTLFTQRDAVGMTDFLFLTARADFIQKNRAALVDFFEDDIRATRWFMDPANHEAAVAIVANFLKAPPERLGWIFTKDDFYRNPNLHPDIAAIQRNVNMLVDFDFIKSKIDVAKQSDLSVIEEAAARIN